MGVPIWCTPRDKWVVLSGIELEWDRGGVRDLGQVLELEQGQGQGKHGGTSGGRGGMGHGQTTRNTHRTHRDGNVGRWSPTLPTETGVDVPSIRAWPDGEPAVSLDALCFLLHRVTEAAPQDLTHASSRKTHQ